MAVMSVTAHIRRRTDSPEIRPIPSNLSFKPVGAARAGVTAARRGRVGQPTIGPSDTIADPADQGPREEVVVSESAPLPTRALVQEAIDTALDSLDALEHQAGDTARRFRRRSLHDAQQGLAHLVESTQTLLKLAVMTAGASGTDIETVCAEFDIAAERETQAALSEMIARQLEHDWFGLARVIDHSFTAALDRWRAVFLALAGSTGPCGHAA